MAPEAAVAAAPRSSDRKLTLSLPAPVVRQLRARMAAQDTTVRALVLDALRRAGYAVAPAEIRDRRRGSATPDPETAGPSAPADLG